MGANFSLVTTQGDVKYHHYRATKRKKFERLVKQRVIFDPPPQLPSTYVESPVLARMLDACRDPSMKGLVVVYCESGLGKTSAASLVLEHSGAGIMFGEPDNVAVGSYWKGVAEYLEVPKRDGTYDIQFLRVLVEALAADDLHNNSEDLLTTIRDRLCLPYPIEESQRPAIPATLTAPAGTTTSQRRVIIFDRFDDVEEEDFKFMKSVYPFCYGAEVLAFVLTSRKTTADKLLRQNSWRRVRPLEGTFTANHQPNSKLPDIGYYPDPSWLSLDWSAVQLQGLVKAKYGEAILPQIAIRDAENPLDVLERAGRIYAQV